MQITLALMAIFVRDYALEPSNHEGLSMSDTVVPNTVNVRDIKKHLTPDEVAQLIDTARKHGRHGARNAAMILLTYQHGLRVSELCGLYRDDVDLEARTIRITRRKGSMPGMHPLTGEALRALRAIAPSDATAWLFANERGGQLTPAGVRDTFARLGKLAGLARSNPHALRHACGYKLINGGTDVRLVQSYLGHKSIASTVVYTAIDTRRYRGLF